MIGRLHNHDSYKRPQSSENMADLHIYVVPEDLWEEQQNLAFNQIISETVSAGFIRVEPEQPLSELRAEIEDQLGFEIIPRNYVFCKSVGRCLGLIRERQEFVMKSKHFLPPNSYCPELFVVDAIVAKRAQMSSQGSKSYGERPFMSDPYPHFNGPELRTGRRIMDDEEEKYRRERMMQEEEEEEKERLRRKRQEDERREMEERERKEREERLQEKSRVLRPTNDPELESRRKEIEELQKEISKRYEELDRLEKEHKKKLSEWEADEEKRRLEEEERRRMFEQMELERRKKEEEIIAKQKAELQKLEEMLRVKQEEIQSSEEQLKLERDKRDEQLKLKQAEFDDLRNKFSEIQISDPTIDERLKNLQNEINLMDERHKELERTAIAEREEAEQNFKRAELEFEQLKEKWEEERKMREMDKEGRMQEEQRLRELYEQMRLEHEKRMEEEKKRMFEERTRFDEEQRHWLEERNRYEDEDRERKMQDEQAIQDALNNRPQVEKFEIKDPELVLQGANDADQKNHLKQILKAIKSEKEAAEQKREEAIKKIRQCQMKIQSKRNNVRDFWKKKYFDEKKKTPPLEDQLSRYKEELEGNYRKLMAQMENGLRDNKKAYQMRGTISPSEKANLILQAIRLNHEIDDVRQKIEFSQMRLSAEKKLREQTENELKTLRIEATQNKIRLTRTRSDQLAIASTTSSTIIHPPEHIPTSRRDKIMHSAIENY